MIEQLYHRVRLITRTLTNRELDATEVLTRDHIQLEIQFLRLNMAKKRSDKLAAFERVRRLFEIHTDVEDAIFYTACERYPEFRPLIKEAREEHEAARKLVHEIAEAARHGGKVNARISKLIKAIEEHVSDEETDLFPQVRQLFSSTELKKLAREIRTAKTFEKTDKEKAA